MKSLLYLLAITLSLTSCDFIKKIAKIKEVQNDLCSAFEHEKINITYNTNTDKGKYLTVTFYEFSVSDKTYGDLEKMAHNVEKHLSKYQILDDLDYTHVRFTSVADTEEDDSENLDSFISFRLNR